jgi:hypothetical protein
MIGVGIGPMQATLVQSGEASPSAPAQVTDLAVLWEPAPLIATLTWTASGDTGLSGTAAELDVRYATTPIDTESAWSAAASATDGWAANSVAGGAAASYEWSYVLHVALQTHPYYFAVRYRNALGQIGPVSNTPAIQVPRVTLDPRYQGCAKAANRDGVSEIQWVNGEQNDGGTLFAAVLGDFSAVGDPGLQLPLEVVSGNEGPGTEIQMPAIAYGEFAGLTWSLHALRQSAYRCTCMEVRWSEEMMPASAMMLVFDVDGLPASALDRSASATGTSATPSSGATATPTQDVELIVGLIATAGAPTDTPGEWTNGFARLARDGIAGEQSLDAVTLDLAYQLISAAAAQTAAKSGMASRAWAALCATFKGTA